MRGMRVVGLVLFAYGAVILLLLLTPWKDWALEHNIAEVVSHASIVLMFAGAWIGIFVPWVILRSQRRTAGQLYGDESA